MKDTDMVMSREQCSLLVEWADAMGYPLAVEFPSDEVRIAWNGSATFTVFAPFTSRYWPHDGRYWRAVDAFTVYGVTGDTDAVAECMRHVTYLRECESDE